MNISFLNLYIRKILYSKKPHSFRHSIVRKANEFENSSKWISLLSQNFGHTIDSVILSSYGTYPENKRGKILKEFPLE